MNLNHPYSLPTQLIHTELQVCGDHMAQLDTACHYLLNTVLAQPSCTSVYGDTTDKWSSESTEYARLSRRTQRVRDDVALVARAVSVMSKIRCGFMVADSTRYPNRRLLWTRRPVRQVFAKGGTCVHRRRRRAMTTNRSGQNHCRIHMIYPSLIQHLFSTPPTRMQRAYARLHQITYFDPIYFVHNTSTGRHICRLADRQREWSDRHTKQLAEVIRTATKLRERSAAGVTSHKPIVIVYTAYDTPSVCSLYAYMPRSDTTERYMTCL